MKIKNLGVLWIVFISLFTSGICFANIVITGNKIISQPTVYNNETLDLTNGSFTIVSGGSLEIKNCIVNLTLSTKNTLGFHLMSGGLNLQNNVVNVVTDNLPANPSVQSLYFVIRILQGNVNLVGNKFTIDNFYTAGLFYTESTALNSGFNIDNNTVNNFHSGFYLNNTKNSTITNNTFFRVSYTNIFNLMSSNNTISGNVLFLPGNLDVGNGIDIIDSNDILIRNNQLFSDSCYGIFVLGSANIIIDNNHASDGKTYVVFLFDTPTNKHIVYDKLLSNYLNHYHPKHRNTNITVTNNYLSQNRYGFAAQGVDGLSVANNLFIQAFADTRSRQFWTNNQILIVDVTNLTWTNNQYKEAYSQEVPGNNSKSNNFYDYPITGGVYIP